MSTGAMDREANEFAIELLMPEFLLRPEIAKAALDLPSGGKGLTLLAARFGVPRELMALRIGQLMAEVR